MLGKNRIFSSSAHSGNTYLINIQSLSICFCYILREAEVSPKPPLNLWPRFPFPDQAGYFQNSLPEQFSVKRIHGEPKAGAQGYLRGPLSSPWALLFPITSRNPGCQAPATLLSLGPPLPDSQACWHPAVC